MRRIALIIVMVLGIVTIASAETEYVIKGKDISPVKSEKTIKKDTLPAYETGWTYNGQPVYISKNGKGSAYVIKYKKKDNTPYKDYLGKELTAKYKRLCSLPIE